jgi:hypothetical protein
LQAENRKISQLVFQQFLMCFELLNQTQSWRQPRWRISVVLTHNTNNRRRNAVNPEFKVQEDARPSSPFTQFRFVIGAQEGASSLEIALGLQQFSSQDKPEMFGDGCTYISVKYLRSDLHRRNRIIILILYVSCILFLYVKQKQNKLEHISLLECYIWLSTSKATFQETQKTVFRLIFLKLDNK